MSLTQKGEEYCLHNARVCNFTSVRLCKLLANEHCPPKNVRIEAPFHYLAHYLGKEGLDAKTILCEYDYLDADYSSDYSSYYVSCFAHYRKRCTRLHFFSAEFEGVDLINLLRKRTDDGDKKLRKSYLGFVVARPLPAAVIGRTVLKKKPSTGGVEIYARGKTSVSLFGLRIDIEDSLAFQSQDTATAACATIAVWTALQATANLFHRTLRSPADITQFANLLPTSSRVFPNGGLTAEQVCTVFAHEGLDVDFVDLEKMSESGNYFDLPAFIYAYLQMGLPVFLGVKLSEKDSGPRHAVVISGCRLLSSVLRKNPALEDTEHPAMKSLGIEHFYVHDDNCGPFIPAPYGLATTEVDRTVAAEKNKAKKIYWQLLEKPVTPFACRLLIPAIAIVPLNRKIRIVFANMHGWIETLDKHLISDKTKEEGRRIWDLSLTTTNDYKEHVGNKYFPDESQTLKERILFSQHPKYLWRVLLQLDNAPALELLADATDMPRACPFYMAAWYGPGQADFAECLKNIPQEKKDEYRDLFKLLADSLDVGYCWIDRHIDKQEKEPGKPGLPNRDSCS